jgi:fructose-1-phosphate kinase PfkB-like protein
LLPDDLSRVALILVCGQYQQLAWNEYRLAERGVENLLFTDGQTGIWMGGMEEGYEIPLSPGQKLDSAKGAAELLSGIIYGLSSGLSLRQSVRIGLGAVNRFEDVNG